MSVPLSAHCTKSRELSHKRSECACSNCPSQSVFFLPVSLQRRQYLDMTLSNGTVTDNNELERVWKGAVLAEVLFRHTRDALKKTTRKLRPSSRYRRQDVNAASRELRGLDPGFVRGRSGVQT
jgi:hypothetical protein